MQKMRIRIKRDGKTEIQVEGGQGESCLAFTRRIEEAVGVVESRVACENQTDELRVETRESVSQREGGF